MSYLNRTNYKYQLKKTGLAKHKKPIFFAVFIVILLGLVAWPNNHLSIIKKKVSVSFNDFFRKVFVVTATTNSAVSKTKKIVDYINLHDKYNALEDENRNLKMIVKDLSYIIEENKALRELNKFVAGKGSLILSGNLAIKNPNAYSKELRLLAGASHGLKEGQIVLDKHAILGRVTSVGKDVSTVLLITDPISKIPVVFPRTGNRGILSGTYDNGLEISILEKDDLPQVNDVVVSSGDGDFFPPGLIVGNVRVIGTKGEIIVTPLFDIKKLGFISVIQY